MLDVFGCAAETTAIEQMPRALVAPVGRPDRREIFDPSLGARARRSRSEHAHTGTQECRAEQGRRKCPKQGYASHHRSSPWARSTPFAVTVPTISWYCNFAMIC